MSGKDGEGKEEDVGLLDRVKDSKFVHFFTDPDKPKAEDDGGSQVAQAARAPSKAPMPFSTAPVVAGSVGSGTEVTEVDAETVAELNEALNLQPGYAKLMQNLNVLASAVPDETIRLKAAISIVSAGGYPQAKLIEELDACVGILDARKAEFAKAAETQLQATAGAASEKVMANQKAAQKNVDEIARLVAENNRLEGESAALEQQIARDRQQNEHGIAVYQASDETVRQSLLNMRAKVASSDK